MKQRTKIGVLVMVIGLLAPAFIAPAVAMDENWAVQEGDDYYFTFGIGGEILLPPSLWDFLTNSFRDNINDLFNDSYNVGFADAYEEAYLDGWNNVSNGIEDPYNYTNPYDGFWPGSSFEYGQMVGYDQGYPAGYEDLWMGNTFKQEDGYYDNWNEDYIGAEQFPGFPQSEIDLIDLETIYTEFMNMDKIFNMHIHIDSMSEFTEIDEGRDAEYYYDLLNLTIQMRVADGVSDYQTLEEFAYDYLNINVRNFLLTALPGPQIEGNFTAALDDPLSSIQTQITGTKFLLENRAFAWATGQNTSILADDIVQNMLFDVLGNFGFNFQEERTYDYGWSQGYEEGYDAGYNLDPWDNPYEGDWPYGYQYGLEQGWYAGIQAGNNDYNYDDYHGVYYNNYYSGANEFEENSNLKAAPSGVFQSPFFIPSDLDVGAQIETVKDAVNIQLARSKAAYLVGGFNGIVDQLGMEVITDEKQVYVSANLDDPKWMFGEILNLGGMIGIDKLNEQIANITALTFALDNETLAADGVFNIQWDNNGVLQNFHLEAGIGVNYLPTSILGVNLFLDISQGEYTALNAQFDTTTPTQKQYPTSLNGVWGVDEGDETDFTTAIDFNVELPQSMWDVLDDELWKGMNETYFDWTNTSLPIAEEANAELIFETLMAEIPNVINFKSKVTDMLGIDENNGTDSHQYDFLFQQMTAKTPAETEYQPLGMLFNDIYDGFFEAVDASFPESFADELTLRLDGELDLLIENNLIEGTDISVVDILQQFVPTTIHMWGISGTGPNILPDFAQEMGIVDDFYFELVSDATALPSILYTPTDFSFQNVYNELMPWLTLSDPTFTEAKFYEFMTNMSVDDFFMTDDQMYMRAEMKTLDDPFFINNGLKDGVKEMMDELGDDFGEQFIYDSVWGQIVFNWEYDGNGFLKNLHLHGGVGMETNGGEEMSLSFEIDVSQGEYNGKNGQFPGEPLIEGYDHWLYPDMVYTVILPQGTGNVVNVDSTAEDVHMSLTFSTTQQVRLSTQIWGDDPSTSDLFMEGTGVYFAIDADNEDAIDFPMTLTVDLRPELLALGGNLTELFQIYTWDETENDWVIEDGFTITINNVTSQVIIEITHLSAFAIGAKVGSGTDTGTGGVFDGIPGYGSVFMIVAMLGAVSFLIFRKRKQ